MWRRTRKLNPGTLMAAPNAQFLRLWRASWFNYSGALHLSVLQRARRGLNGLSMHVHSALEACPPVRLFCELAPCLYEPAAGCEWLQNYY